MLEGIDYCYIYPKDDKKTVHIRLLDGKFKDTVFKYGKVKFEQIGEDMHLIFAYDVLESKTDKPKKLNKNEEFKNYIGDLLVCIMSGNLDEEIIDDHGTDDTEKLDIQR